MTDILFQYSTLGALMSGVMTGSLPIKELLTHGDLGIGTLDGVDGEVMILDGMAYQAQSSGEVVALNGEQLAPYAAIIPFKAAKTFTRTQLSSEEVLADILTQKESLNSFSAVKITGHFNTMHVRVMPKQTPPYKKFSEVTQPEFTQENITGTIMGFFTPELFHGMSVAGFHLHFLADDYQFGGHILDFDAKHVHIDIQEVSHILQEFPQTTAFKETLIDMHTIGQDISQSE